MLAIGVNVETGRIGDGFMAGEVRRVTVSGWRAVSSST
jgi:hypothetical protein